MNTKVMKKKAQERRRKAKIRRTLMGGVIYIAMMIMLVIAFMNWLEGDIPVKYEGEYTTYIVADGDRLWNIAEEYSEGKDVREVVYIIEKDNGLDSASLTIGQELKIRNEF